MSRAPTRKAAAAEEAEVEDERRPLTGSDEDGEDEEDESVAHRDAERR